MDRDRRQLIIAAGAAVASVSVGGGLALLQWLRPDSSRSSSVDAIGTSTSTTARRTTTSTAPASTSSTNSSTTEPPTSAPTTTEPAPTTTTDPPAPRSAAVVEVLCREAWGAAPPRGTLPRHTIKELTVHHTAAVLNDNRKAPSRVRNFQKGHQDDGFVDLAYHYVIDAHGTIYAARSTDIPGETYTNYDPTGHFLAVCDGNFEQQSVPAAQLDALARLLAWASAHFGVPSSRLTGHRDEAATACPGEHLYAHLRDGSLRAAIDRYLAAGPPKLVVLCGSAGTARVAAVEDGSA